MDGCVAPVMVGSDVAVWLEALDPESLGGAGLIEAVGACGRLEAWVSALRARLMVRFEDIAESATKKPEAGGATAGLVHAELAAVLRWPEAVTREHLDRSRVVIERLPGVWQAWTSGVIGAGHANAVAQVVAGGDLSGDAIDAVEARVLERAEMQTVAQVRRVVRAAVDRADPQASERRHQARVESRSVRLCPDSDGVSVLRAELDAPRALILYGQVSNHAAHLRTQDPHLGMDQARADALVALVDAGAAALRGQSGGAGNSASGAGSGSGFGSGGVQVWVTVDWQVLAGLSNTPAHLQGHGSITANQARELAYGPDATWRRLLTDPVEPTRLNLGRTRYRPPVALADHVRAVDRACIFPTCNQPADRCQLDHNKPYGNPDGTGTGGQTSAENLAPICRWHHNLKTNAGWTWTRNPNTGQITWTTPTGHTLTNPRP